MNVRWRTIGTLSIASTVLLGMPQASVHGAPFVIDTFTGWDGAESVAPFGDGDAGEAYGQTFQVLATHPTIQSFSFWAAYAPDLLGGNPPQSLQFNGVLMAWNVDRAAGPVLFSSPVQVLNPSDTTFMEFMFNTGGLGLVPGQEYVAFLNASAPFVPWDPITSPARVGFRSNSLGDAYPGGEAWFKNTDGSFANVFTPWGNPFGTSDLVFRATFAPLVPAPEPASFLLLGPGVLALGAFRRRRS